MSFRTFHFDGVVRVPGYLAWLMDCDMRETYTFHRRVLKLLQWHCPPDLWHLKTPVHMFALDALVEAYPNAKFMWSHRDPAKVLGSVCSLIRYVRSWSSDREDPRNSAPSSWTCWAEGVRRAMDFRKRVGDDRFVDVVVRGSADRPGQDLGRQLRVASGLSSPTPPCGRSQEWAREHKPGARGAHDYDLADYGLTPEQVRERFAEYLAHLRRDGMTTTDAHDSATNSPPTPVCAARSWPRRRNLFASKGFEDSASLRSLTAPS